MNPNSISFTPDGKYLCLIDNNTIEFWDYIINIRKKKFPTKYEKIISFSFYQ